MIITIAILILNNLVLFVNNQNILLYHSSYIALLVVILRFHQQPQSYQIDKQTVDRLRKDGANIPEESISNRCQICDRIKPCRYYHCRRCKKCIYRMDHHCNWIDNCIGQYNVKVYLHLLVNIFLHCLALVFIVAISYKYLLDSSRYQIYYFVSIFPALYGLYQSYRLINDLWLSVKTNQTLVQSFKKVVGKKISIYNNLVAHLGKNKIRWFIPYFQSNNNCDLLQKTVSKTGQQVKQYIYADQYIDGTDQQDQFLLKQE